MGSLLLQIQVVAISNTRAVPNRHICELNLDVPVKAIKGWCQAGLEVTMGTTDATKRTDPG